MLASGFIALNRHRVSGRWRTVEFSLVAVQRILLCHAGILYIQAYIHSGIPEQEAREVLEPSSYTSR